MDITVVIPTLNRARMLSDLLDSLKTQKAEGLNWEVLVVDNGSTDDTPRVVELKKTGFPVPLRYIYEPNPGLHNGRNRGAAEASGRVVSYLDDDVVPVEQWIQGGRHVLEGRADLVGGRVLARWEAEPPGWVKFFFCRTREGEIHTCLGLIDLGTKSKLVAANHVIGNCFARREVILGLKGYHPDSFPRELIRFRGDGENGFTEEFMRAKLVSLYSPVALVYHRISSKRLTADYFCQRAYNEGISGSFVKFRQEHGLYGEPGKRSFLTFLAQSAYFALGQLQTGIGSAKWVPEYLKVSRELKVAYRSGYDFHQREVRTDPELLRWVLRPDYFGENGRLPTAGVSSADQRTPTSSGGT